MSKEGKVASETLGRKASSVFGDVLARDLASKAHKFRKENLKLKPIYDVMRWLEICGATDATIRVDINLFEPSKNGENYLYQFDNPITFPHEKLNRLIPRLCGNHICPHPRGQRAEMSINEGKVLLVYAFSFDLLVFRGTLENYPGTEEEIHEFINSNRYSIYFSRMGMLNLETGAPVYLVGNPLAGSLFKLEGIEISKTQLVGVRVAASDDADTFENEARVFASAFPYHDGVQEALKSYSLLRFNNWNYASSRQIFQTLVVSNSQERILKLQLENGSVGRMLSGDCPPS